MGISRFWRNREFTFPKDVDRPSIFLAPRLPLPLGLAFLRVTVQISHDLLCVGFTPNEKLEGC